MRAGWIATVLLKLCCLCDIAAAQDPPVARDAVQRDAVSRDTLSADSVRGMRAPVVTLAPLTVMGVRPAVVRTIPGATHVFGRNDLHLHRPAATHDLLRRAPGIHVQDEDALGTHLNIGVRGMDPRRSSRVLLLEDGMPIHLAPYTDPSAHYLPPAEVLDRIEVLKGSGQVMHGPQTVGGVINFVRAPPPGGRGTILLRAGDRGRMSGHAHLAAGSGPHRTSLSLNRRHADGSRRGAVHRVTDASAQALFDFARTGSLLLRAGVHVEDVDGWGESGLTQAEFESDPFMNPSPRDRFDLRRFVAQAVYARALAPRIDLTTSLYAQDTDRASWRQASSSGDRFGSDRYAAAFACAPDAGSMDDCGFQGRPRHYRFAGLEPRITMRLGIGAVSATVDGGARVHVERAHRRQFIGPRPGTEGATLTRDNALTAGAWSAFLRTRIDHRTLALTPGIRLEHVRLRNDNRIQDSALERDYTQLLPGIGASWNAHDAVTLFAGSHRGFAPPRPADILSPAPGLGLVQVDPELSWNHEAGLRIAAAGPGSIEIDLEATMFRTDFENQIVEGSHAGSGQRFVNAGSTRHDGIDAFVRVERAASSLLRPRASIAWTWVRTAAYTSSVLSTVDDETSVLGRRLPFAPRHMVHGDVGLAHRAGFHAALRISRISSQFADDLNSVEPSADGQRGMLPACTLLGASAGWRMAGGRGAVFATAENLRNTVCITERLEGIMVGSPRRLSLGVEWNL